MLVFFLIIGGLLYLASVYIKQKHGTFDNFMETIKGVPEEDDPVAYGEETSPDRKTRIAPSPEEPDIEAQEAVPEPTQEQLSKWKELEEMCKPGGLRSVYTGFTVDEETGEFVPEYENIDCCYEQPWENEGECVDGQQKQVRGVLNEDLCEVEPQKEQMLDCCSYGEWENDGDCIDGVQKQKRQIFNPELCVDTTTTREIDCCSYGEWELDGECVDGNQNYKRTIINSDLCEDTSLKKTEPCCLPLEWANDGVCKPTGMQDQIRAHINRDLCVGEAEKDYQEVPCCYRDDWQNDGTCDFSEGKISQKRTIKNADICRAEGDAATSQTVDCCYIGPWVDDGPGDEETGIQKQGRKLENEEMCPTGTKKTQEIPGCKRGPWVPNPNWNYGRGCNDDGEIGMARTITLMDKCRNPDPTSEENRTVKVDKCCAKGEWFPEGECVEGKQKLTRTILNEDLCDENDGDVDGTATEKMGDCCGLTDWEPDKSVQTADENQNYCKPDGKRTEKRILMNRNLCYKEGKGTLVGQPTSREVDCCYVSEWEDVTEGDKKYGVDQMWHLKKLLAKGVELGKFTQNDVDTIKKDRIKPCGPDGEIAYKRTVRNPEICWDEVNNNTRSRYNNYNFKEERQTPCCTVTDDWVPVQNASCKKHRWGNDFKYDFGRARYMYACYGDVKKLQDAFIGDYGDNSSDKIALDALGYWEHERAYGDGINIYQRYVNGRLKKLPNKVKTVKCNEDGTLEGSDYNWKDFTRYDERSDWR